MEMYPAGFLASLQQEAYLRSFDWLREAKIGLALSALLASSLFQLRDPAESYPSKKWRKTRRDERVRLPLAWLPYMWRLQ